MGARCWLPAVLVLLAGSCIDTKRIAVKTTAQVLQRGQAALKMESDYEHAARAMPTTLKSVESFHVAYPDIRPLTMLLAEGYCQYGSGFVEDEWEEAYMVRGDLAQADAVAERASKMYTRCSNYGIELLGERWRGVLAANLPEVRTLARDAGRGDREGMLWLTLGLVSTVNLNLEKPRLLPLVAFAQLLLERLVVMDGDGAMIEKPLGKAVGAPEDPIRRALPHLALGMLFTSRAEAVGGDPERGRRHFERAIALTGGKFLLARVLFARGYGRATQNRALFVKTLVDVLRTDPAVWPEQRLANEIAHRRARRYLHLVNDWF